MRKQTVETKTADEAYDLCPWAYVCTQVEGGFMCFESSDEYLTWARQQLD